MFLGNLNAKRDWGHARDYVKMQWMMLQRDVPDDFVIATGKQFSVREFIEWSAEFLGIVEFKGNGVDEVCVVQSVKGDKAPGVKKGQVIVKIDLDTSDQRSR